MSFRKGNCALRNVKDPTIMAKGFSNSTCNYFTGEAVKSVVFVSCFGGRACTLWVCIKAAGVAVVNPTGAFSVAHVTTAN